jgi:signal transduction histidine kinase
MSSGTSTRRPWRAALLVAIVAALAMSLVAAAALARELRADAARTGDPLARTADDLAARLDAANGRGARALMLQADAGARLLGPRGRLRIQTGDPLVWSGGSASWPARLATTGVSGWALRDGAVEARRALDSGGRLVLRRPLPAGVGGMDAAGWALGLLIGVLALGAGGATWWFLARRSARTRRLAAAVEGAAQGRVEPLPAEGGSDWRRLTRAIGELSARADDMRTAAESRVEALGAAIGPMAHPVVARTPAGSVLRNEALERMLAGLGPADRDAAEDAIRSGLASSGPVSRRLALADGRSVEVEAWSVPGGRLVSIGERTEQARLAELRRRVTGAAARHLQAPVSEVQALGSELVGQVPAEALPTVRRIQATGDRMERLVGQMLRGTEEDPRGRPMRLRPIGAGGIAYALGRAFDRRLRDRGLRLETRIPEDLPPLRTDPALVHEILSELIANSATFTPRGGTITLAARLLPAGRVELSVADTGPGIPGEELHLALERFGRGEAAHGLPGAGLGLGVAGALAERLGGHLEIEPGPDGRARLELPAASAPRPAGGDEDGEPVTTGAAASSP